MELNRDNLTAPPGYPAEFIEAMFPKLCYAIPAEKTIAATANPERHPLNNAERKENKND